MTFLKEVFKLVRGNSENLKMSLIMAEYSINFHYLACRLREDAWTIFQMLMSENMPRLCCLSHMVTVVYKRMYRRAVCSDGC